MGFSQGDFIWSEKVEIKENILSETNFFTQKITRAGFLFLKQSLKWKSFNTTFKMETLLAIAYTHFDKKSQPFKTNSLAIGTKELHQRKIYVKKHFFLQNGILKFVNRVNGGYKIIVCTPPSAGGWTSNHGDNMEIKLWVLSASIKQKCYCFEDFTKLLAFFCVSKNINWRK